MVRPLLVRKVSPALVIAFVVLLFSCAGWSLERDGEAGSKPRSKAKNIIFMVTDGMGLADVTAARIFKNGPDGERLHLETLTHTGLQRTHSADNSVTDSAAAASAWASGEEFRNGEISCHDDNQDGKCEQALGPPWGGFLRPPALQAETHFCSVVFPAVWVLWSRRGWNAKNALEDVSS